MKKTLRTGMLFSGLAGILIMALLSPLPVLAPVLGGFVAGAGAGNTGRGLIAGFTIGVVFSCVSNKVLNLTVPVLFYLTNGYVASAISERVIAISNSGMSVAILYFAVLSAIGGAGGGFLWKDGALS